MKKFFTLLFLGFGAVAFGQSTTVVISQVYGGGGATSGSPAYNQDYVELHNISNTAQDISGFSVQYGSATGNFGSSTSNIQVFPAGTIIPAGGFLLISGPAPAANHVGPALPVTPDFVSGMNMSGSSGKVALVNISTALGCGSTPCTLPHANIIDLVSYGTANNAEGGAAVKGSNLTSAEVAVRKNSGCVDTDNNSADFDISTSAVPRNSSSTAINCTTLPITLASFSANATLSSVILSWNTSSEINAGHFVIEKSTNAKDYATVGTVKASGNENGSSYEFSDELNKGVVYYRLKMVDKDGSFTYSKEVMVRGERSNNISVYPNPVKDVMVISHSKSQAAANIEVFNTMGVRVLAAKSVAQTEKTSINVANLPAGNYILVVADGSQKSTINFVKH